MEEKDLHVQSSENITTMKINDDTTQLRSLESKTEKIETDGDLQTEIHHCDIAIRMEEEALHDRNSDNITNKKICDINKFSQLRNCEIKTEKIETDISLPTEELDCDIDVKLGQESLQGQSSENTTSMKICEENESFQLGSLEIKTEEIDIKIVPPGDEDTQELILDVGDDAEGKY